MYFSVVSVTSKPFGTPACASSCFAFAMSILRCGTREIGRRKHRRERTVVAELRAAA